MRVLGVDPGSRVTGYGVVEKEGDEMACIHYSHIGLPDKASFYNRIHNIFQGMVEIIKYYAPQEMAIEDVFYAKNFKAALKLGHARGAVLIAAVECKVPIFEYTPLEIKKSVVGYGRAGKEQVRSMVQVILKLRNQPGLDASDALAAAICHLNWSRFEDSRVIRR
jgi:crossover junction endodeoxyribonuclease RuvC